MRYIMGLDLSLTNSGIVLLPDTSTVSKAIFQASAGYPLKKATPAMEQKRLLDICRAIEGIIDTYDVGWVGFEQTPYNRLLFGQIVTLAQLGGVVYGWLLKLKETVRPKIEIMPVNIKSARKHLFAGIFPDGWVKRRKAERLPPYQYPKDDVKKFFESINMHFDSDDTMDAFVIANYIKGEILKKPSLTKATMIV